MYTKNRQSTGNIIFVILCSTLLFFIMSFNLKAQEEKSEDEIFNTSLWVEFGVDYNRDGKIEFSPADEPFKPTLDDVNSNSPYVFWLNDDDDKHQSETDGNDVPGTKSSWFGMNWIGDYNYESDGIDGTRDLIDFFPVAINFNDFFTLIPDEAKDFTYKLKHEDEALNIVYSAMTTANSDYYLKEVIKGDLKDLVGSWQLPATLNTLTTHKVTSDGIELPSEFIDFIKTNNNQGVLLVEVRAESEEPLVLSIENEEGVEVLSVKLPLKLVQVEDMYAQVNIRGAAFKDGETSSFDLAGAKSLLTTKRDEITDNLPKSFKASNNIVFLHGFKVDAYGARAWHAEMFKRLYHSGSNAYYTGVTWKGDEGGGLNYWGNVENALNTAPIIKSVLTPLTGQVTVAAHSLGNMVIGEAIQRHGFTPNNYFMLNPAVPTEAYNTLQLAQTTAQENVMVSDDWQEYYDTNIGNPRRLWPTDWHRLFPSTDNRNKLTWGDLFVDVVSTNMYQFYSEGEEVLAQATESGANANDTIAWGDIWSGSLPAIGINAWIAQEHQKGKTSLVSGFSGAEGGWGYNCIEPDQWWRFNLLCNTYSGTSTIDAFALINEDLRLRPFFKPFIEKDVFSEDEATAKAAAFEYKDHILAYGIPALSHAAGSTQLEGFVNELNSFQMNADTFKKGWPAERGPQTIDKNWLHSDAKDVSYRYVYTLFDTWIEKGNLNK